MSVTTSGIQPRRVDVINVLANPQTQLQPAKTSIWPLLAPSLASALVLWMCFFPLAWGWLGWVALVPFLSLVRAQGTPRRIYLAAWLGGSAFFWPILLWMPVNDHMVAAWVMLAVYCSLYFPVTLWLIRVLDVRTRWPLVLTAPLAWVAMEWARSWMLTGFAWYYMGHTQHNFLSMIQIADLGGVYLISLLVVAVNAWLFDLLYQIPNLRDRCRWVEPPRRDDRPLARAGRRGLIYEGGVVLLAVVGTLIYGGWRLSQTDFGPGPTVSLLQTNIEQKVRNDADDAGTRAEAIRNMGLQIATLCKQAVDYHPTTDLIIWPETSYPWNWLVSSPRLTLQQAAEFRQAEVDVRWHLTSELLKACPTNHLLGLNTFVRDDENKERRYNSALLLTSRGGLGDRYDKMHRVPFGEFVPFRDWRPLGLPIGDLVNLASPYDYDYSIAKGEKFTRFALEPFKFGVLICYEDTDPFMARRYVVEDADGKPVDFLVNISNDGWFEGGSEHDEHLAISRFRAIECRRAVVRAVNMGISGVIDGNGRVLRPTERPAPETVRFWRVEDQPADLPVSEWHDFKKTAGVIRARVPIDTRSSFYARTGDWLPIGSWAVIGGVFGWSMLKRRRQG
jgi:apolipoprotein N-acyltransferase